MRTDDSSGDHSSAESTPPKISQRTVVTVMAIAAICLFLLVGLVGLGLYFRIMERRAARAQQQQIALQDAERKMKEGISVANRSSGDLNRPISKSALLVREAMQLMQQKQLDAALEKANAVIQSDPQLAIGYNIRGGIYALKKQYDAAAKDYQTALQLNPNDGQAKFNLAEIQFQQKQYDLARPGFFALEQDKELDDLALYKVFLCDLFGGHEDVAAKELADMDQVGSSASFYFAKAAWALYHQQTSEARDWLHSASKIYKPAKFKLYSASLYDLGYLPLPAPAPPSP